MTRRSLEGVPVSQLRLALIVLGLVSGAARAADCGVYLYLQPLPPDLATLTFAVTAVSAVSASGSEHPLDVAAGTVTGTPARQRLLASGSVPAGSYTAVRISIARASLRGTGALPVPDVPVRVEVPFVVGRGQSPVLWMTLAPEGATAGGKFTPDFGAQVAPRPIADHVGLVSNTGSDTITVFDKALGQVAAVVDTCARPAGMVLDRHRRRAYVACTRDDEIQAIDLTTMDVAERARLLPGDGPRELALTPDAASLVAVNGGSSTVAFFESGTLARQERIAVAGEPSAIAVEPQGRRAFVFCPLSNTVSVVDLATRSAAGSISTDASPTRGHFSPRGDRLFVVHERTPFMSVIDPRQLTVLARARVRSGSTALAMDTVRQLLCLGGPDDDTIELYDLNALVAVNTIRIRSGATYMAIDPDDGRLYVVNGETRRVVVATLADRKVVTEIDAGEKPYWVVVMGAR